MNFKEWLFNEQSIGADPTAVEESEIDRLYDKAHISVELVREYKPELLYNISIIANLATGAYGLYNSGENKKVLQGRTERLIFNQKHLQQHDVDILPKAVLKQYFPEIDEREIRESDTIHVNIRRILQEASSDLDAVLQIASTIVHESTHESEKEQTGKTSEVGPTAAEREFMNWAKTNMQKILSKHPELAFPW
jgi:hypothetical protein